MGDLFICAIALYLFGRCLLVHVPLLVLMIWRARPVEQTWWDELAGCPITLSYDEQRDVYEAMLFAQVPSAVWLDPTRWERSSWPAPAILPPPARPRWDRYQGGRK